VNDWRGEADADFPTAGHVLKYLLKGNIRYQDDLVDQLFNATEILIGPGIFRPLRE
jgi:hypothetical protein